MFVKLCLYAVPSQRQYERAGDKERGGNKYRGSKDKANTFLALEAALQGHQRSSPSNCGHDLMHFTACHGHIYNLILNF